MERVMNCIDKNMFEAKYGDLVYCHKNELNDGKPDDGFLAIYHKADLFSHLVEFGDYVICVPFFTFDVIVISNGEFLITHEEK